MADPIILYVDADACPVKDEVIRVATRHKLKVYLVSDGGLRPYREPHVETVFVPSGPDAADNWIAERILAQDICITNDTPLAGQCLEKGAFALRPTGKPFTQDNIGMALANRELMNSLRETGAITGGPRPFAKKDRSAFLNALEPLVQKAKRERG
ncbi:MAG: YaiI/YqxD family protein [Rhodospirillaceae bacterium]